MGSPISGYPCDGLPLPSYFIGLLWRFRVIDRDMRQTDRRTDGRTERQTPTVISQCLLLMEAVANSVGGGRPPLTWPIFA